jgi:hypothetical protein
MGEEIWLDPNHEEATAGVSTLILACMPALSVVTNVWQNGTMSPTQGVEVSSAESWMPFPKLRGTNSVWRLAKSDVQQFTQSLLSLSSQTLRPSRLPPARTSATAKTSLARVKWGIFCVYAM